MQDVLLSIIVPVFNVEHYIIECIESIIGGGFDDKCELIMIDDGSTDSSGSLCEKYKSKNVHVIHQNNGGLAAARNAGLSLAKGFYVTFVDSDDYLAEHAISNSLKAISTNPEIDLFFMQCDKVYPNGKKVDLGDGITSKEINNKNKMEVLNFLKTRNKFAGSSCTKIYRRWFLIENAIAFPTEKRRGEDLFFTVACIYHAKNYCALDFPYYRYRQQRTGSITNSMTLKGYSDIFAFLKEATELLTTEHNAFDDAAQSCMSFVAYEYALQIWKLSHIPNENKSEMISRLKEYRWVLKYAGSRKVKMIRLLLTLTGYHLTSAILDKAKSLQKVKNAI